MGYKPPNFGRSIIRADLNQLLSDLILHDPILSLLILLGQIWTDLFLFDMVWSNLIQFGPTNLIKSTLIWFEPIWINLNQIINLNYIDPIWTNLNQLDPTWSNLNQFYLIWTQLSIWSNVNQFHLIWTFKSEYSRLWNKRSPLNKHSPPLKNFYITILILFYINLGIAVIFNFFLSSKIFNN